jgi:hypothetical protein
MADMGVTVRSSSTAYVTMPWQACANPYATLCATTWPEPLDPADDGR